MQNIGSLTVFFSQLDHDIVFLVPLVIGGHIQSVIGDFQGVTQGRGGQTEQRGFLAVDMHLNRWQPTLKVIPDIRYMGHAFHQFSDLSSQPAQHLKTIPGNLDVDGAPVGGPSSCSSTVIFTPGICATRRRISSRSALVGVFRSSKSRN